MTVHGRLADSGGTRVTIAKYSFKEEGNADERGKRHQLQGAVQSRTLTRNINGVIKANDEKNLNDEVNEYVLTEEICRNLPNSSMHTTTRRTTNRTAQDLRLLRLW